RCRVLAHRPFFRRNQCDSEVTGWSWFCGVVVSGWSVSRQRRPSCISRVPSHLIPKATLGQPSCLDGRPTHLTHQLRETAAGTRVPTALGNFQNVKKSLGADALNTIVPSLTANAFKRQAPAIDWVVRLHFGLDLLQRFNERHLILADRAANTFEAQLRRVLRLASA